MRVGGVLVDIDDTIIEVHGYAKQGSGYGYSGVRGLNALLATVSTSRSAPVVVAQRLRKGSCGSPRGAGRLVADALKTVISLTSGQPAAKPLVRADAAFYGHAVVGAAPAGSRRPAHQEHAGAQQPKPECGIGQQPRGLDGPEELREPESDPADDAPPAEPPRQGLCR